ncbi:BnaC03g59030D [Brassica napus]|uniref:BnaC03g59030D protein n=1 Tax=Brassica napus TaxID=3708 RepID=A0A078I0G0_BRANA|nr:BnaC03g59030D [Brassica napus]
MHVKSYDWVEPDPSELDDPLQARPAKLVKDMTAPCPATTLYNLRYLISFVLSYILMEDTETTSGNPQSVTCLVNITGLRLSIVTMENVVDDNDDIWKAGEIEVISNVTWLEEYQPPDNFVIWKVPYRGPTFTITRILNGSDRAPLPDFVDTVDNVNKREDIPVDRTVLAKVETGVGSQQAAPDAVSGPDGGEPQRPSARAASKMVQRRV